ncbi:hypothetical protein CO2235_150356 [Cupriavidus oxalaticus]|uniref:Uncharacterized protein n=1 Tax=Cupriavidus oxalaticus TaxID=96344 RepID=A0A976BAZ9_9BURK|nr:hypothetical protein CO2235_150356 [Cupriavidus oxalaticus]
MYQLRPGIVDNMRCAMRAVAPRPQHCSTTSMGLLSQAIGPGPEHEQHTGHAQQVFYFVLRLS